MDVIVEPGDRDLGTPSWGRPFPAGGSEYVLVVLAPAAMMTAPGATSAGSVQARLMRVEPLPFAGPLEPMVSPPRDVLIDGEHVTTVRTGAGATPTLSWSPPRIGTAARYEVSIRRLEAFGTGGTGVVEVATLRTSALSATVPPGILEAGRRYVAVVHARAGAVEPDTAPARAWAGRGLRARRRHHRRVRALRRVNRSPPVAWRPIRGVWLRCSSLTQVPGELGRRTIVDAVTLQKLERNVVQVGDEVKCKYEKAAKKNVATSFRKAAGRS